MSYKSDEDQRRGFFSASSPRFHGFLLVHNGGLAGKATKTSRICALHPRTKLLKMKPKRGLV